MSAPTSGFEELPPLVKAGLGAIGLAGIAAVVWKYHTDPTVLLILLIGLILVVLLVIAWGKVGALKQKSKGKIFSSDLSAQLKATPQQVTGAEGRAKLDDLRRKLQEGFDKLAATGKSPYILPWYLVVGEPGSGKTKAIAAANIALPGFQDPLQGTGGTVNMNWWFTNNGIVLDTAGRLMLPEVPTSNNPEWDEFLRTLNKKRPDCPINGLILTIPADTLITDSADKIDRKAGEIAVQFNKVQTTLGIRFPVFVLITKCDKILGFREFFESLNNPDEQGQMLGWSNPDKLDDPFRPELVEQHLQKVYEQLIRRRLRLIQDPVHTEDPAGRRLDQVDALYELPDSLLAVAPRLRRYLEPIFVAGPLSSKPLFLRGIFFTSSLQTGEALDKAISAIMGVDIVSEHGGPVVGEKPYFLRHVFQEKVFREKGLVTRTDNVAVLKRRRKLAVIGAGFASVATLIAITWLGKNQLERHVEQPVKFWGTIEGAHQTDAASLNFLDSDGTYRGQRQVPGYGGTLVNLHAAAPLQVGQQVQVPIIFRPVAHVSTDVDEARRLAYRQLYESSVIRPLLARAQQQMSRDGNWSEQSTDALQQLLLVEAGAKLDSPKYADGATPISPLAHYVLRGDDLKTYDHDKDTWETSFKWLYSPAGGRASWPPADLAGDKERGVAIHDGVVKLIAYLDQEAARAAVRQKAIQTVADLLEKLDKAERSLLATKIASRDTYDATAPVFESWQADVGTLDKTRHELDAALEQVRALDWKPAGAEPELAKFYKERIATIAGNQQKICENLLACVPEQSSQDNRLPLVFALQELSRKRQEAQSKASSVDQDKTYITLKNLEGVYLTASTGPSPQRRYALHDDILKEGAGQLPADASRPTTAPSGFLAFVADMDSAGDATRDLIKAKVVDFEKTTREAQLADVAREMVDLGLRRRREQTVAATLRQMPDDKGAWSSFIHDNAQNQTTIKLPLTTIDDSAPFPNPSYDPAQVDAQARLWSDLKTYCEFGSKKGSELHPVMDFVDLDTRYKSAGVAWTNYLGDFANYWHEGINKAMEIRPDLTWSDIQLALKGQVDIDQVNHSLSTVAERRLDALRVLHESPATQPKVSLPPGLVDNCTRCRANWIDLDRDPSKARVTLLSLKVSEFKKKFLFPSPEQPTPYDEYWGRVFSAALKSLATECNGVALDAMKRLKDGYHRFPLVDTPGDATELTPTEMREAQDLISRILDPAPPDAGVVDPPLAAGRSLLPPKIADQIELLSGHSAMAASDPRDQAWVQSVRPWVNALVANDLGCELKFTKEDPQGTVHQNWNYVNARLGDDGKPIYPESFCLDASVRENTNGGPLPETGGKDVQLIFSFQPTELSPAKFVLTGGNWPFLRLISDSRKDRKVDPLPDAPMGCKVTFNVMQGQKPLPIHLTVRLTTKSKDLKTLPDWVFKQH